MTNKFVCIHGHFYQPPRENPWLEAIEYQESAKPYHDWNERIMEECYAPNAASRILDDKKITAIVNNYNKISFNFGPTLLSWIKENNIELYRAILNADKDSQNRFNGHGNALAQAYNHMILPLANSQDKYTQILWGIRDFECHFQRKPEGLWLAETAVDLESLSIMSELGIKFTILAPNQFKHYRALNEENWRDDFSSQRPYLLRLPHDRKITIFFYDGEVSKAVAFEKLLTQGETLANRLLNQFSNTSEENPLVHIATDGETYGHHHHYGDMGLAFALQCLENTPQVKLTNYANFCEIQPPEFEVEIHENSSWSCAHGINRWCSDCGCNSGTDWHQKWRQPLREALDWLRDTLIPLFKDQLAILIHHPWGARNDYIDVIENRNNQENFFKKHAKKNLSLSEKIHCLKWMELQRHAMLMYTSCAWFFDEISGIETVQVLKYAARVIQLAKELTNQDLEPQFLEKLRFAPSNIASYQHGAYVYETFVKPSCITLNDAIAHIAASLPFSDLNETNEIYSYTYKLDKIRTSVAGKLKLISGFLDVMSKITLENNQVNFIVFYQGDQNLICTTSKEAASLDIEDLFHREFEKGDVFSLVRLFEEKFGNNIISLRHLFFDMKKKIVDDIIAVSIAEKAINNQSFLEDHLSLLDFISANHLTIPSIFNLILNFNINAGIVKELDKESADLLTLESLLEKATKFNIAFEEETILFAVNIQLKKLGKLLASKKNLEEFLLYLHNLLQLLNKLPLEINYWYLQNKVFEAICEGNYSPLLLDIGKQLSLKVAECSLP